ncbi:hypothetical protein ACOMHN_017577 [Nucella lapillus]
MQILCKEKFQTCIQSYIFLLLTSAICLSHIEKAVRPNCQKFAVYNYRWLLSTSSAHPEEKGKVARLVFVATCCCCFCDLSEVS